jgi:hypothetical protein
MNKSQIPIKYPLKSILIKTNSDNSIKVHFIYKTNSSKIKKIIMLISSINKIFKIQPPINKNPVKFHNQEPLKNKNPNKYIVKVHLKLATTQKKIRNNK